MPHTTSWTHLQIGNLEILYLIVNKTVKVIIHYDCNNNELY